MITYYSDSLNIAGVQALLTVITDKEYYFANENISSLNTIINGTQNINNGMLELKVNKYKEIELDEFMHFLPKSGWHLYMSPFSVAAAADGSIYIAAYDIVQKFSSEGSFIKEWGSFGDGDGQFYMLTGIAVSADGYVYVVDSGNNRIQKFDNNGNFITKWGAYGSAESQFDYPFGIDVSEDGYVYVTDMNNNRIQKFDSNGNFVMMWGTYGSGDAEFNLPSGIAIGSDGIVYIADTRNNRIQKFDADGNFITKWGSFGTGNSQFNNPYGVEVSFDGYIYVADTENNRVQKFDSNGNFILKWGTSGKEDGYMLSPRDLAADLNGFIFLADTENGRIQKFTNTGNFILNWGNYNIADGHFKNPYYISIAANGNIYVADTGNNRIQKFNNTGDFMIKWGNYGTGAGEFNSPSSIAVDNNENIYVCDSYNHRIQKFDSNGNFILSFGSYGSGDGQFDTPTGISVDSDGFVYVVDSLNNRIQKFDNNANFITKWGSYGSEDGQFDSPRDIAVAPNGYIYVADSGNNRIQVFDSNGNFISKWGIPGYEDGQFGYIIAIAVAPDSSIYISDIPLLTLLSGDITRIQKFDNNGNFIKKWDSFTINNDYALMIDASGIAIASDGTVYIADTGGSNILKRILVPTEVVSETLFEATISINQTANTSEDYPINIGMLNTTGKLYLEGVLFNEIGQTITEAKYPFYILENGIMITFSLDKQIYKPGEMVNIIGDVRNLTSIDAEAITIELTINFQGNSQTLYTSTVDIPAGGSYPFSISMTPDYEGVYIVSATASQNGQLIVNALDQFEVAAALVSAKVSGPNIAGNSPFELTVELKNEGKIEATINISLSNFSPLISDEFLQETITIAPAETKIIKYIEQISSDTTFTFSFTGDINQTIIKTVEYGVSASLDISTTEIECQTISPYYVLCPEGHISIPIAISNTGLLDEELLINYQLTRGSEILFSFSRSYYIPAGNISSDILEFNLTEGDYSLLANSQLPSANAQVNFSIRKENKLTAMITVGQPNENLFPTVVTLTNLGINDFVGILQVAVIDNQNEIAWSVTQNISLPANPLNPIPFVYNFNIDASAITQGNYNVKAEVLTNNNLHITEANAQIIVQAENFVITQLPAYQSFSAGEEAVLEFNIKNTGNHSGNASLQLKAYDLIDLTRTESFNAGEEKTITFSFQIPEDSETKDYFANYILINNQTNSIVSSGQIRYKVVGLKLNVNAQLDKQNYNDGDTAHLTLSISNQESLGSYSLVARINYASYESQQNFTLNGNQTLVFDVSLEQITGEKLFYGIYFESGRSIYLNSLYIHKVGDVITVSTDKQVYSEGEIVSVQITGNTAGQMTLNGPGGYQENFQFNTSAVKSFVLPAVMVGGAYSVDWTLDVASAEGGTFHYEGSHPFDVVGISIKIKETKLDRAKYLPSDIIAVSMNIESNRNITAILRNFVLAADGDSIATYEEPIMLEESEPSTISYNIQFMTTQAGIHRLFYQLYIKPQQEEIILATGSEAFDVGNAVITGLSTDKINYSTNNEPVNAIVQLFGYGTASIDFYIDDQLTSSEQLILNGSETHTFYITNNINPGSHKLKAVLRNDLLESSRETTFRYGTDLPDLAISLYAYPVVNEEGAKRYRLAVTVKNEGKSPSSYNLIRIYEEQTGYIIEEKEIPSLNRDEAYYYAKDWEGNGFTGTITISTIADPYNLVTEYNEANNKDSAEITIANLPPDCTSAQPSLSILWPPNHNMQQIKIISVSDPEGDNVSVVIDSVSQDEPTNGTGDGDTCPDAVIQPGSDQAEVRAERSGNGNGRVYHIHFIATDQNGASCAGEVLICVPHNKNSNCIDEGNIYSSILCQ